MQLICLVRKLLIMPSKLGAYLKTKEATGTTGHTDQPNPNPDLNLNSNLGAYVKDQQPHRRSVYG